MATQAIVGEKVGMTQTWVDDKVVPVTVVRVEPMRIVQIKTPERDGYSALQVTYGVKKKSRVTSPEAGHFEKASVEAGTTLVELRIDSVDEFEVGQHLRGQTGLPATLLGEVEIGEHISVDGHETLGDASLGGGDCVDVCDFGALEMGPDGLPFVYDDLCTACSPCVNAYNNRVSKCLDNVCMRSITVDQVYDKVRVVLAQRKAARQEAAVQIPPPPDNGGQRSGDGPSEAAGDTPRSVGRVD